MLTGALKEFHSCFFPGFKATRSYDACLQSNNEILNQTGVMLYSNQDLNASVYSTNMRQSTEIPPLLECDLKKEIEKVILRKQSISLKKGFIQVHVHVYNFKCLRHFKYKTF